MNSLESKYILARHADPDSYRDQGDKRLCFSLNPLRKHFAIFAVKYILLFFSITVYSQNPLIIAHRGASAYAPENTLSAFEKAIQMGTLIIETDVHQTKDSVIVIMHDLSVDRTTDGKGMIKDLSAREFKTLRVENNKQVLDEHPPTLEEAIRLINGRCKLLIELKKGGDYYPNIEKHIVDLLKKYNAHTWVYTIHSFDKQALINVAKRDSNINLQKLIVFKFPLVSFNFDKQFTKDDFASWQGVNVYYRFCTRRVIKKIHRLGKTVYVWTVNKPRQARKFTRRGVDGIITNKPDILQAQ